MSNKANELQLMGKHSVSFDDQGRITLPKCIVEILNQNNIESVVTTIPPKSECILIYPPERWDEVYESVVNLPNLDEATSAFVRKIIGLAYPVKIVSRSRISIKNEHLKVLGIESTDKGFCIVGVGKRLELWSDQQFLEHITRPLELNIDSLNLDISL